MSLRPKKAHKRSVSSIDALPAQAKKKKEKELRKQIKEGKKKAQKDAKTTSSEEENQNAQLNSDSKKKKKKGGKKSPKDNFAGVRKELSHMTTHELEERLETLSQLSELIKEEIHHSPTSSVENSGDGEFLDKRLRSADSVMPHAKKKKKKAKTKEDIRKRTGTTPSTKDRKKGLSGSRSDTEAKQRQKKWPGWQKSFHRGDSHNNSTNNTSSEASSPSEEEPDSSSIDSEEGEDGFLDLLDFPSRVRKPALRSSSNMFDVSAASELKILGYQAEGTTKLMPLVAEIAEGNFNYCEMHPANRGMLVRENESEAKKEAEGESKASDVPPVGSINFPDKKFEQGARVIFGHREGYIFDVRMKISGNKETKLVELAADNEYQRQKWAPALWDFQPSDKILVFGFLWMKVDEKKNFWKRYFVMSNGRYMEWFKAKNVVSLQLKHIRKIKRVESNAKNLHVKGKSRSEFLKKLRKFSQPFALIVDSADGASKKRISLFWDRSEKNIEIWNHVIAAARKGAVTASGSISRRKGTPVLGTLACSAILNTGPVNFEPKMFDNTGLETPTTTKLRNGLRQFNERGIREAGKTPFGNYRVDVSGVGDGHMRIICLDGGGIRGILQTIVLDRLVEIFPTLLERTDLFAGISVGSMTATGLACGRSPRFLTELMCFTAPFLFDKKVRWTPLRSSKFSPKHLYIMGREFFSGFRLGDVPKGLLIPSFLLDNELEADERSWEAQVFHNIPQKELDGEPGSIRSKTAEKKDNSENTEKEKEESGSGKKNKKEEANNNKNKEDEGGKEEQKDNDSDSDVEVVYSASGAYFPKELLDTPVWDCVMGSAAAPTFYPSYKKQIDAAVMTNDPSLTAISMAMSHTAKEPKTPEQIHVLSLSTGTYPQYVDGDEHDWGMIQWGPYLLQMLIAASGLHERQLCKALLGDQIFRVDPILKKSYPIDDESVLEELMEVARNFDLTDTIAWIKENWFSEEEKAKEREKEKEKEKEEQKAKKEKKERERLRKEKKAAQKKKRKQKQDQSSRKSMGLHGPLTSEDCWYGTYNLKD